MQVRRFYSFVFVALFGPGAQRGKLLVVAENKAPGTMKEGHIFTIEPMINQGE